MILSEKITMLRKQKGWSQEELAEKLGISRQSVSKWESTASLPDLDKIIKMSDIFGVSTDYLLKDELEEITAPGSAEYGASVEGTAFSGSGNEAEKAAVRNVSLGEANTYLDLVQKHSIRIAPAVFLLICSPICLIIMSGLAEFTDIGLTENMAGGFGVVILLFLVALGVIILILSGMALSGYDYLEKENIALEYGVSGIVEMKKQRYICAHSPQMYRCGSLPHHPGRRPADAVSSFDRQRTGLYLLRGNPAVLRSRRRFPVYLVQHDKRWLR